MRRSLRWGCACALLMTIAGAALAQSEWVSSQAEGVWNVFETQGKLERETVRADELQDRHLTVERRMVIKDDLLEDYADGRIQFEELVREFRLLNDQTPSLTPMLRYSFPGTNDTERTAHNVAFRILRFSQRTHRPELVYRMKVDLAVFLAQEQIERGRSSSAASAVAQASVAFTRTNADTEGTFR